MPIRPSLPRPETAKIARVTTDQRIRIRRFKPADLIAGYKNVFYGWKLVGVSVFMLALMSVAVFQGLGTFLVSLERHFGWRRGEMSFAFSLARGESAVLGPIEGWLIDRLGNRRMVLIGYVVMAVGFIMFAGVNSLWQFYAAFMVVTLGSGLGGWLAMISMVNNWFVRKRSLAIAAAMSGIHVGGFMLWPLAYGVDNHGFRWTTLGIGVFLLVIILPVWSAIRNRPEDMGLLPDGDRASASGGASAGGAADADEPEFTARQALRTRAFWALAVVHLSSSVSIVTLSIHLAPKLTDMGLSLTAAAFVPLIYTAVALPAQFVAGFVADRYPKQIIIFIFLALQAAGILILAFAEDPLIDFLRGAMAETPLGGRADALAPLIPVVLFAVSYGIGFGGRIPLLTAIRGEYFGRKAFATIMGISQFPNNIAMIFAPLFAGYMYDSAQSYQIPFAAFAALAFMGAALMLTVKKPRRADAAP